MYWSASSTTLGVMPMRYGQAVLPSMTHGLEETSS